MSSKGQIVLPAELRREDALVVGEECEIERLDAGTYRLVRCAPPPNQGMVEWLLSCPEKDWFVPIESGSTDDL
jgi:bifunctional DNA-binding transcriptional regulator/antitoxin component of YhaV-PrlF toxin-antitoxin module